jgi:hypothetical protein
MTASVMSGTLERWLLCAAILVSFMIAPGLARAATTHAAGAAIGAAPVGKEHALTMPPALHRGTSSIPRSIPIYRSRPSTPTLARSAATGITALRAARPSGVTHMGIDGSAVRRRQ